MRRGHTEDTDKHPAVVYTFLTVNFLSQNKDIGSPLRWKASTFAEVKRSREIRQLVFARLFPI